MRHYSIPSYHNSFTTLRVISVLLVIARSDIRMAVGTPDTIVISSIRTEVHNLNNTNAFAASKDGSFPANLEAKTAENRQVYYT